MKVYVAGSSKEQRRAAGAMHVIRDYGLEVAFDWIENIRLFGRPDHEMTPAEQEQHSNRNVQAITESDLLWFLIPQQPSAGPWFEFGVSVGIIVALAAVGSRPMYTIASGDRTAHMFTATADYLFSSDVDAARQIRHICETLRTGGMVITS